MRLPPKWKSCGKLTKYASSRLTVIDEARNILFYFGQTLCAITPRLYDDLNQALAEYYPDEKFDVPTFLRYGSWVGGDRDGNPTVTLDNTSTILAMHRRLILDEYIRDMQPLRERLSESINYAHASTELVDSLNEDALAMPGDGGLALSQASVRVLSPEDRLYSHPAAQHAVRRAGRALPVGGAIPRRSGNYRRQHARRGERPARRAR